jgi:hypothetical protein
MNFAILKKIQRSEAVTLGTLGILAHFSHFFLSVSCILS